MKEGLTPSQCFGQQLKKLRWERRMTQDDLARRVTDLGVPMGQSMVARLENGNRTLSVNDAIALALSMEVPLIRLLSPDDVQLALTPTFIVDKGEAHNWFLGLEKVPGVELSEEELPYHRFRLTKEVEAYIDEVMQSLLDEQSKQLQQFKEAIAGLVGDTPEEQRRAAERVFEEIKRGEH